LYSSLSTDPDTSTAKTNANSHASKGAGIRARQDRKNAFIDRTLTTV
jgi:hypothetical protein